MNLNDEPEKLIKEEQSVLNVLIAKMNRVIKYLDKDMQKYVKEAKNAQISINPDLYLSQLLAQKGMKDTNENRKKMMQARDELYHTRLLLQYENTGSVGIQELKIGLHQCVHGGEMYIISWKKPLCRHYLLDNTSTEFESVVEGKYGIKHHTNYKLLVKNQITLRFTRVKKAINMYPGIFDDKTLKMIKGTGFLSDKYLDEMIKKYDPNEYDPDATAKIIADEFLQELLERRSTPEFKNIVFSIQKKQGEIIQAPYEKNMVVQGCAGSGKSMIMLHRLPILLYDNPESLKRTSLYVITPSQMYTQLSESMRYQLEISDIKMGTIEEYYDFCISKYPGHKGGEYGKISYASKISPENERYVYSSRCISDIKSYFENRLMGTEISMDKAVKILNLNESKEQQFNTYVQKIRNRIAIYQNALDMNNGILAKYFVAVRDIVDALRRLSITLLYRKENVLREIAKLISKKESEIRQARKEIDKLDPSINSIAIQNRYITIDNARDEISKLQIIKNDVDEDDVYFHELLALNLKVTSVLAPFENIKNEFSQNPVKEIYTAIDNVGQLIGGFYMLSWELSRIEDKYASYLDPLSKDIDRAGRAIGNIQIIKDKYLSFDYYNNIKQARDNLAKFNSEAINGAYESIMRKLQIKPSERGSIRALRCSPYIYLQVMYLFHGSSSYVKESLLAIDEAQGIAPEEIRLLNNVNDNRVVFNLYGDINQHIEGTKGIESWEEYKEIIDFDFYEIQENYRNALQITEFCNKQFDMKMNAINTPGKGVHEILTERELYSEIVAQLMDVRRTGLAAILVGSYGEAKFLIGKFADYEGKLHDMTDEDFSIHRTRWNIIHIDDAKGLEFNTVIVLSGRMSRNQKYIAYTRALDDLYVYQELVDGNEPEKVSELRQKLAEKDTINNDSRSDKGPKHKVILKSGNHSLSRVRKFFEENGLKVIDKRDEGGRLWVIGEKTAIRDIVNAAIAKFKISGKYTSSKDILNQNGWCTKTDK